MVLPSISSHMTSLSLMLIAIGQTSTARAWAAVEPSKPGLSQPSHELSRRHRTRASSPDTRWTLTRGDRHHITYRTAGRGLGVKGRGFKSRRPDWSEEFLGPSFGSQPGSHWVCRSRARSHYPAVGDPTLTFGASTSLLTPACGSPPTPRARPPSDDTLKLFATWAATLDQAVAAPAPDGS